MFDKENENTERALRILDAKTGVKLHSIRILEAEDNDHFYGITLQDKYFFGGLERTIDVYDLEAFQRVKSLDLGENTEPEHLAVTWLSAQESFLFCICQKTLKVDFPLSSPLFGFSCFIPSSPLLLLFFQIFELLEGTCIQSISLEELPGVVSMVALTHSLLLIFAEDASFRILNVSTKNWQQIYKHEKDVVANSIAFNKTHFFASVNYKGRPQLLVWEFNWAS
jgi:hypothetical protein